MIWRVLYTVLSVTVNWERSSSYSSVCCLIATMDLFYQGHSNSFFGLHLFPGESQVFFKSRIPYLPYVPFV